MGRDARSMASFVIGRSVLGWGGKPLTIADLPAPQTNRWVIQRKAKVVAAVDGGLLRRDEACRRYNLTDEEFTAWEDALHHHGLAGLRVTHSQDYRDDHRRRG